MAEQEPTIKDLADQIQTLTRKLDDFIKEPQRRVANHRLEEQYGAQQQLVPAPADVVMNYLQAMSTLSAEIFARSVWFLLDQYGPAKVFSQVGDRLDALERAGRGTR